MKLYGEADRLGLLIRLITVNPTDHIIESKISPPPAGTSAEAVETARVVGFRGGLGSTIAREE